MRLIKFLIFTVVLFAKLGFVNLGCMQRIPRMYDIKNLIEAEYMEKLAEENKKEATVQRKLDNAKDKALLELEEKGLTDHFYAEYRKYLMLRSMIDINFSFESE